MIAFYVSIPKILIYKAYRQSRWLEYKIIISLNN